MNLAWWLAVLVSGVGAEPAGLGVSVPAWRSPSFGEVRTRMLAWLDQSHLAPEIRAQADELWSPRAEPATPTELLERAVRTFALADENARKLVQLCSQPKAPTRLPAQPWLMDPKTSPWMAHNLRLWYGRWLAQQRLFEEAKEQLDRLQPDDVVDPATLLFYQAVVAHRLVDREAGLEAVRRLLDVPDQCPRRYATLARLLEADLRQLQEDSLDHIARRMEDIQRRLQLGRAGPKVRKLQDGVIESLDKLIEELEAAEQQQQAASAGSMQPSRPAQDSFPMGGKGPGLVTKRAIGTKSGWGDLPPKEREEALQQVDRQFPAHYRDIIEQYFRKLAAEERG